MPFDHFYVSLAAAHDDDDAHSESSVEARVARRSGTRVHFPVEDLQRVYHLPLKEAAQELGICEAALKRICRRNHIKKWPYRQLQSVMRRIEEESRLVAMHCAFRKTLVVNRAQSERFLLPHELEDRRKASEMDAQLTREQYGHTLRVEELKRERELIIETAHTTEPSPSVRFRGEYEQRRAQSIETPPSIIMLDTVSVDDPLDMLASLCASEISRPTGKAYLKTRDAPHEDSDISSMEVISCVMAKVFEDE